MSSWRIWLVAVVTAMGGCQCGTPGTCNEAADCAAGESCEGGQCITVGAPDGSASGSSSGSASSSASSGGGDAGAPDAAGGDGGADCPRECPDPQVCRLGACIPPPPACSTDEECSNDSRCVDGECIPYGVGGDSNPSCNVLVPLGVFTPATQCEWQPTSTGTACTNPCNAGEWCMPDENLQGSYCTSVNGATDTNRPCTNPCSAAREVCIADGAGVTTCQDPFRQLLTTITVVDFDLDQNPQTLRPSLVFASYPFLDGGLPSGSRHGVLRIVDGETCQTLHTIDGVDPVSGLPMRVTGSSAAALGDLDGDGRAEIVSHAQGGGLWAFTYDVQQGAFRALWHSTDTDGMPTTLGVNASRWSGPAIHDLDDDGVPEILSEGIILNSAGRVLGTARQSDVNFVGTGQVAVAADVDLDGRPELVTGDQQYDFDGMDWTPHMLSLMPLGPDGLVAIGDFGAFDVMGAADPGYPEVVVVGGSVRVRTLDGQDVFPSQPVPPAAVILSNGSLQVGAGGFGGPPTVGDFDGDGRAEFAEAGGRAYTVFDFDCLGSATACTSDAECGGTEHCPLPGRCSKSSTRCSTNTDCPSGEDCFILYAPTGHCSTTTSTACSSNDGCPSGEQCRADSIPRRCVPQQCEGHGILWTQVSQDLSSNRTASSIFDFEADGQVEAVYSDECYTRVYDGESGSVLFSQMHTSCTWYENPIIADVDGDLRSEIVIGSNENCTTSNRCFDNAFTANLGTDGVPSSDDLRVDPIFAGLRCTEAADCPGALPECADGLCRCASDADCGGGDFACAPPIAGTTSDARSVCRAVFRPDTVDGRPGFTGVRVYRDQADRWVGSRPIWNQHAYAVTHVGDRGEIPRSSAVSRNWETSGLNNFRQNVQGSLSGTDFPDVTSGGGTIGACEVDGPAWAVQLQSRVCNRGTSTLGAGVPVTFYVGEVTMANVLCTAETSVQLAPGACETVACRWTDVPEFMSLQVLVRADDDGMGSGERTECVEGNNTAAVGVVRCGVEG